MDAIELKQLATRLQVIHAGFMLAAVGYVAIAWLVLAQQTVEPEPASTPLLAILGALGAVGLPAGPRVRRLLLRGVAGQGQEAQGPEAGPRIQRAYIAGAAVSETGAVFGFLLTFMSGQMLWVTAFSAATVAVLLASWPSESRIGSLAGGPGAPLGP